MTKSRKAPSLVQNVNWNIVLDGHDHGLENVHIPAIGDPQTHSLVGFREQTSAQRHAKIPCHHSKNHRLSHPNRVSTFHRRSPVPFLEHDNLPRAVRPGQWYRGPRTLGAPYYAKIAEGGGNQLGFLLL